MISQIIIYVVGSILLLSIAKSKAKEKKEEEEQEEENCDWSSMGYVGG